MAGRGRAATLPAWMTAPGAGAPPPGGTPPGTLPTPPGPPGANRSAAGVGAPPIPPAAPAPAPGAADWTAHRGADGREYFFNALTRQSTYEKPEALMTPTERADATTRWREHVAADGRSYYYHKDTKETKWQIPDELRVVRKAAAIAQAAVKAAAAGGGGGGGGAKPRANGRSAVPAAPAAAPAAAAAAPSAAPRTYANKDEAKNAFKELLSDKNATAGMKWEDAMRLIIQDERYGALKTLGEKKQCFNEWQTQKAKQDREEKRLAEKATREAFKTMLRERADELGWVTQSTRLKDIAEDLVEDARWVAVKTPRDREDLFREFLDDQRATEREERRIRRKETTAAYRELLVERGVKVTSVWRKVHEQCANDPRSPACDRVDRLETFVALMEELEKKEADDRETERIERLRTERKNREAFVEMIDERVGAGLITLRMPWRTFAKSVSDDLRYIAACENFSGSRPKELYEDAQEKLEADAAKERDAVIETARVACGGMEVTAETDVAALADAVRDKMTNQPHPGSSLPLPEASLARACADAVACAKERARVDAKREARALDDFARLIKSARREVRGSTTWEEAEAALGEDRDWIRAVRGRDATEDGRQSAPGYPEKCEAIFAEWTAKLAAREAKAREALEEGEALLDELIEDGLDRGGDRGGGGRGDRGGKRSRDRSGSRSRSRSRSPGGSRDAKKTKKDKKAKKEKK